MLPVRDRALMLEQVAGYWARELDGVRTDKDILAELHEAFWRGELMVCATLESTQFDRRRLLEVVSLRREHPGFVLVERVDLIPVRCQEQPDGGAIVDLQRYIVLPSDPVTWTEQIVAAAYEELARVPARDFHSLLRPIFYSFFATKDALGAFCDQRGYQRPTFWFGKETRGAATVSAELRCEKWLLPLARGAKDHSKSWYREQALRQFPGLSARGFDRVWDRATPPKWKSRGAPEKKAMR